MTNNISTNSVKMITRITRMYLLLTLLGYYGMIRNVSIITRASQYHYNLAIKEDYYE